jgi:hypothetical protein
MYKEPNANINMIANLLKLRSSPFNCGIGSKIITTTNISYTIKSNHISDITYFFLASISYTTLFFIFYYFTWNKVLSKINN